MQAAARAAVRAWRAPAVRACWTGGDIGRGLWGAARARPPLAAGEQRAERGVAPGAWRQAGVAQAAPHGDCRRPLFTARAEADDAKDASPPPLSAEQKKVLFVSAAVPMVGFGFMDNMVMITMGEAIDATFGVTFGLTTLTAAGFGQIFSDISGICFGGTVEAVCSRLGLPTPKLTPAQAAMGQTKRITTLGAVCGVTVGCLLGMSILFFKDAETEERKHDAEFSKMLSDDDKDALREYVAKIKGELAQAEAALFTTEAGRGVLKKRLSGEVKK